MAFLADTWMLWFVLAGVVAGAMVFARESRRQDPGDFSAPSSEDFSIKNILFGVRRGEGDLFLGYLFTIIFFSMFLAGFIRWISSIF